MALQYRVNPNASPVDGVGYPDLWGTTAPDGTNHPFKAKPIGSTYVRKVTDNQVETYIKVKDDNRADDWRILRGIISKYLVLADFTDGGGVSGTYTFTEQIPIGAFVEYTTAYLSQVFNGSASATVIVGDGTDTDRYNTGTPDVKTATGYLDMGVPSGVRHHAAAKAPVVTVAEDSDFTTFTTGKLTVAIHYGY